MSRTLRRLSCLGAGVLLCLAACAPATQADDAPLPELGLMGSIPIYWGEAEDVAGLLGEDVAQHWARPQIETAYRLRPLDTLSEESLSGLDSLLLAQPRALAAAENVALDAWVRGGGSLLLFADPMLTGHSRFALGDRRRPQDVILLSPILRHWGLQLEFDAEQPEGDVLVTGGGPALPVNLPGQFGALQGGNCQLSAGSVLASCRIGAGNVVVLADAALLDLHDPHPAAPPALDWLLDQAFADLGENAG